MSGLEARRAGREPWWQRRMVGFIIWTERHAKPLAIFAYCYFIFFQGVLSGLLFLHFGAAVILVDCALALAADVVIAVGLGMWVHDANRRSGR